MYYFIFSLFLLYACGLYLIIDRFKNKNLQLIYVFTLSALSVILALRPENVPDFQSYKYIFEVTNWSNNYTINILAREPISATEYGFVGLVLLYKAVFGNTFRLFLFLIDIVTLHFTVQFIRKIIEMYKRKERNVSIKILLLFFPYYGLYYQGIAIRSAISIMFIMMTLYYFLDKKYSKSLGACFAGFLFQRITIIAIVLCIAYRYFPVLKKQWYMLFSIIFLGFTAVCNITHGKVMGQVYYFLNIILRKVFSLVNYNGYLDRADTSRIIDKKRLFIIVLFFVIALFVDNKNKIKKFLNMLFISCVLVFATLSIVGAERIYDVFSLFFIPIICIEEYNVEKHRKLVMQIIALFSMFCNFIIAVRIWLYPA